MKEYIEKILEKFGHRDVIYRRNILKEYLQENILYIIYRGGFFRKLVFEGGTALRFLFDLKRFSEDLDFSLCDDSLTLDDFMDTIKGELELMNYAVEIKTTGKKAVKRTFFKFPGLLHSHGLSEQPGEKVSVLVEIDINPPEGGDSKVSIITRNYIFRVRHYSIFCLFAKKICAVFSRPFDRGRDYYDLMWFLGREVEPDFELLNSCLKQVDEDYPRMDKDNWKSEILKKLKGVDFNKIRADVRHFLEVPGEVEMLRYETFNEMI